MSTPMQIPAPKPRPGTQSTSPFVRKCLRRIGSAGPDAALAVDVPSGYGRHSYLLVEYGYDVIVIDADERALRHIHEETSLGNNKLTCIVADCRTDIPLATDTMFIAVVVHFILSALLQALSRLLRTGGYLVYETYGGNGGNYLTLPSPGQIAAELHPSFELIYYQEKPVGPKKDAVTVKCLAKRVTAPLDNRPACARGKG
jgi:SAM-dependent methyltransferase